MVVAMLAVVFFSAGCLLAREFLRRERQRAEQREALRREQEEELCGKLGHDDKQRSALRPIPAPEDPRYRLEAFENGEWRRVHFFLETRDACYEVWREFVTDPEVENSWDAFRIVSSPARLSAAFSAFADPLALLAKAPLS